MNLSVLYHDEPLDYHVPPAARINLTAFSLNINPPASYPTDSLDGWNCYLGAFANDSI